MSKKFKSQASSSRAASTAFGITSSFGFGNPAPFQTATSLLSYVTEQPDLAGITNANVVVALKNLSKKDSTTKEKALDEILEYLGNGQTESGLVVEGPLIEAWINFYPRIAIDNSRRVRQLAHNVQGSLTVSSGKRIAPHLPKIIGSWLSATFDQDRLVARSAAEALRKSFSTEEKRRALWRIYQKDLVEYVEDAATVQTSLTLSDERTTSPDDAAAKYVRVVGTSLLLLNAFLIEQSDNISEQPENTLDSILGSSKLWAHVYHSDPFIRKATCTLFATFLSKRPQKMNWKIINASFISKGLAADQFGSTGPFSLALLSIARANPGCWLTEQSGKTPVSKRLLRFLQKGSQRGPATFWENVSNLIQQVPQVIWNNQDPTGLDSSNEPTSAYAKKVLTAYRSGINSSEEPRQNLTAAWKSYIELGLWFAQELPNVDEGKLVIKEQLFPLIQQYVLQGTTDPGWTIATPAAVSMCVQLLGDVARTLGVSPIETFWKGLGDDIITSLRTSRPEQSATFRSSQDEVVSCSKRFSELAARLLDEHLPGSVGPSLEKLIGSTEENLVKESISILDSRMGKPYGAAGLVTNTIALLNPGRLPSHSKYVQSLVLDFMDHKLISLINSPSAETLVQLLSRLRADSDRAESLVSRILSGRNVDLESPAAQALIPFLTEEDFKAHPEIRNDLLDKIDHALKGNLDIWHQIGILLHHLPAESPLKEDAVGKMLEGLSLDDESHNAMVGFKVLLSSDAKASAQHNIGSENVSNLLSRLLVLEELLDDDISQTARQLANQIREDLKKAGSATKSTIEIVRQQLLKTGEDALSIHTVTELAREAYNSCPKAELSTFADMYPSVEEWKGACEPFLGIVPVPALAITSILQGATLAVQGGTIQAKVEYDSEGLSVAARLASFVVKLSASTDVLINVHPDRQSAMWLYLPLVLQVMNERLNVANSNESWLSGTQEVVEEMNEIVVEGRKLILKQIGESIVPTEASTASVTTTLEQCWVQQLDNMGDGSPRTYRTAVVASEILAACVDKFGPQKYAKLWADDLSNIRKSSNIFRSAVLVYLGRTGLLSLQRLCTEFIVDITSQKADTRTTANIAPLVQLNLLLDGNEETLTGLPIQRLVYLVKALVQYAGNAAVEDPGTQAYLSEALKLLNYVLPSVSSIYDEFWALLWDRLAFMLVNAPWDDATSLPLLHSTLKLCATYDRLVGEEANDDLVELWEEQGGAFNLAKLLTEALLRVASGGTESLNTRILNSATKEHHTSQPLSITIALLGRISARMPVDKVESSEALYSALGSNDREIQSTVYDILSRLIVAGQEQKSVDIALSKEKAKLPGKLLELVAGHSYLDDGDRLAVTDETTWARPRKSLLAWKLIFDHFTKASHKLREMYAEHIKSSGQLEVLLDYIVELLRITAARPVDVSRYSVDSFDFSELKTEPYITEAQALGAHLYYLCLLFLPNLTRSWWIDSKNQIKTPMETWTQKQITPKLHKAAMAEVDSWLQTLRNSDDEEHALEVKISNNNNELVASIPVDPESSAISLMVSLPAAYPLQQAVVSPRNRVAVSEKNWQSWLRTIKGIIMFSNGGIIDGLLAFRRNVQGALKGQSECAICYSIIGTDMKTPDKKCGTCKNTFHGACLFRWFSSSNSSTCPLCRNSFNYA